MNSRELKAALRQQVLQQRLTRSSDWIAEHSSAIAERFMAFEAYQNADTVCLYMALPGEVDLCAVMPHALQQGKRVLIPAFKETERVYGYKAVNVDTRFAPGLWGVDEPQGVDWAEIGKAACVAVPGVIFSEQGDRIGFGKGYYDRLLKTVCGDGCCFRVGVGFDYQIVPALPFDDWDIRMDAVVSESRVLQCAAVRAEMKA